MITLDHISPSQISMYLKCPRQWEYRYIKGIISPPSISLIVGSAYHDALAMNFMQKMRSMLDLPVGDVLDAFSTSWDRQITRRITVEDGEQQEFESLEDDEEDTGTAKDVGVSLVKAYQRDMASLVQPAAVEKSCEVEVGAMKIVGRLDLETVEGKIIDHKTSARSKTQAEMDRELQPSAYGLMTMHPVDFDYHIALKIQRPKIQVIRTPKSSADLIWFLRMAQQVWASMHAGIYPPNCMGWWCDEKYCGYHSMCRGGAY